VEEAETKVETSETEGPSSAVDQDLATVEA